jgi:hypothetical protein
VRSAAALALAAVDDDTAEAGSSAADVRQAGVNYARCMRDDGFDVPYPRDSRVQAAMDKCEPAASKLTDDE